MRVYRLEDLNGSGPYQDGYKSQAQIELSSDHNTDLTNHPSGVLDFEWDDLHSAVRFACASLDGLIAWFGRHIDPLLDEGFDIVVYEVPPSKVKFGRSGRQVVFNINHADAIDA